MKTRIILLIALAFIVPGKAQDQKDNEKIVVSGFVTDANNRPVADALILVDKLKTEKVSDKKGFFKIEIKPDVKTIGAFASKQGSGEVEFSGTRIVHIVCKASSAKVESQPGDSGKNEMVNIGYGEIRKKDVTANTGKIEAKEHKYDSYTNIYKMIEGELSGVQVKGTKIIVRGAGSFHAGSDPLFIVDGMEATSIDMISPREVKSISVLKGSDASIYGSRGGNGVILIDLKKGGDK